VYIDDMIANIEPWLKRPDLKPEHLSIIATLLRDVRSECAALHQPEKGDGEWCLGSRVYQRTCFAITELAKTVPWLSVNAEQEPLRFSFRIGSEPLRFYKGDFTDPPSRYLSLTGGEEDAYQLRIQFDDLPAVDTILRLAIDVDATRQAASVTLVEIDEYKEVVGQYRIPFGAQFRNITPMLAPPVNMLPVVAKPLKKETTEEKIKEEPKHVVAS
jgi:hypothetical protein